ncbi:T3SS effector HopA1 family protein [Vibrio aestuarianus]|uniref:T3SS effector HopA1 family protein n=1 Tax=Vibrio aestuarianus TaxID=28171 RepID=UPI00237CFD5A|nr:T3SS effector HopA1 family protein [Vibrio aestuarianus]MDE1238733.1 T3SS effector HopA1 family protein [Vibrio aestuarianus]
MRVNLNSPKIPSDSSVPHEGIIPKGTLSVISISNTNPTASETLPLSIKRLSFSEKEFSDRSSKGTSSASIYPDNNSALHRIISKMEERSPLSVRLSSTSIYEQASRFVHEYPGILSKADPSLFSALLYKMYADDTHPDMKGLNKIQKEELCDRLSEIRQKGEVHISEQSPGFSEFLPNKFGHNHVISPLSDRADRGEPKIHSRLTLTLQSSKVKDVLRFLAGMVRDNPSIIVGKMLSPDSQGFRTDSVILYLQDTDIDKARELAAQLNDDPTLKAALIDHTPMGMKSLAPGVSYSEFSNIFPPGICVIDGSSHGRSMSYIVASAIVKWAKQEDRTDPKLYQYIAQEFRMCGYDPNDRVLLRNRFDDIELVPFFVPFWIDYRHQQIDAIT